MLHVKEIPVHPELVADGFTYDNAYQQMLAALDGNHSAPSGREIAQVVLQLSALLLKKNVAYGDSALDPVEVFATDLDVVTRMAVRMDDKLSRLARGAPDGEDPEMDLAGYLMLFRIAKARRVVTA